LHSYLAIGLVIFYFFLQILIQLNIVQHSLFEGKYKKNTKMVSRGDYQPMHAANANKKNENQIEILDREMKYLCNLGTTSTNMQSHYNCISRRATQVYEPKPCIMHALRWGFTFLALFLLSFVLVMFVVIFYDVFCRSHMN
jgi:hypothetical protein